jgi:DNA-directed RNA polymerase specialized sigma24 family protein
MVADVVAAYPEGLTHAQISALLCVSETHARRLETQAMAHTEKAFGKRRAKRGITKGYGSLA